MTGCDQETAAHFAERYRAALTMCPTASNER
jgi:hypothetical protein